MHAPMPDTNVQKNSDGDSSSTDSTEVPHNSNANLDKLLLLDLQTAVFDAEQYLSPKGYSTALQQVNYLVAVRRNLRDVETKNLARRATYILYGIASEIPDENKRTLIKQAVSELTHHIEELPQQSESRKYIINNFGPYSESEQTTIVQDEIIHTGQGNINKDSPNINIIGENKDTISQSVYSTASYDSEVVEKFLDLCNKLQELIAAHPDIFSQEKEDINKYISTLKTALVNPRDSQFQADIQEARWALKGLLRSIEKAERLTKRVEISTQILTVTEKLFSAL